MSHPGTLILALFLASCAAPSATAPAGPRTIATSAAPPKGAQASAGDSGVAEPAVVLDDARWELFVSRRFGFRVPLPDARRWSLSDHPERWWALVHEPSGSSLRLRSWRAERRVDKEACREQVYLWQGSLRLAGEPVLDASLAAPRDYDTKLVAEVRPAPGEGLLLVAVAYGATVGRCYAAVLETQVSGGGAEAELGRRLRLFVEGALNRVELVGLEEIPVERP